ncbi:uncharacterized protein Z520_12172 [Fonsecaea multimorphosa CBS 102226]|uniref:Uncharacterized protein n=1 Tax=Fonsecaea multimorphosa CBS 102226 TaxID=1442371 RepID=A0A0D2K6V3_9EURO|nr:uncharacterized protein Z520_12172 [Fonsecaea multimorphosa CBS 102226]KIX92088.1 hypothetical protein Z520_12172 [Fonsecaea multimorphosa CBS 102226]OAL17453.1 hypothetical protein AYO22_11585 [Fonsecaea multimorphosa]
MEASHSESIPRPGTEARSTTPATPATAFQVLQIEGWTPTNTVAFYPSSEHPQLTFFISVLHCLVVNANDDRVNEDLELHHSGDQKDRSRIWPFASVLSAVRDSVCHLSKLPGLQILVKTLFQMDLHRLHHPATLLKIQTGRLGQEIQVSRFFLVLFHRSEIADKSEIWRRVSVRQKGQRASDSDPTTIVPGKIMNVRMSMDDDGVPAMEIFQLYRLNKETEDSTEFYHSFQEFNKHIWFQEAEASRPCGEMIDYACDHNWNEEWMDTWLERQGLQPN